MTDEALTSSERDEAARSAKAAARESERDEARRRATLVKAASRFTPYIAAERDGALFFIGTESEAGQRLFKQRAWGDHRALDRALRALKFGGIELAWTTFVDVGAHIGTTTIHALLKCGFSSAVAFEPEPENFRILRANLAVNGLDGLVQVFNVAMSDKVGSGHFHVWGRGGMTHRLARDGEATSQTIQVPITTFDALAAEGAVDPDKAALLWIDVEGSEIDVLAGARTLVERAVPIVMEFTPRRFRAAGHLESFIEVVSPSYTHFYHLNGDFPSERGFQPLSEIEPLRHGTKKIDLLVARLPR